jgi:hypothetical protein
MIEEGGALLAKDFEHGEDGMWIAASQPSRRSDPDTLSQQVDDLDRLLIGNPQVLQRLRFGECPTAVAALETLHDPVFVAKMAEPFGFTRAPVTFQLAFPGKIGYSKVVSEKICDRQRLILPVGCAPWALTRSRSFDFSLFFRFWGSGPGCLALMMRMNGFCRPLSLQTRSPKNFHAIIL